MFLDKKFIGQKFKFYRNKLGLKQEKVAEMSGIAEKHYGRLERGLGAPSIETFFNLINCLNIPLTEFGIFSEEENNILRKELIKEIYLSNSKELEAYLNIIKTIKNIKSEN